jgi:membrane-bound serine protease (ClpP class)
MAAMELVIALLVLGILLMLAETILPGMIAGILGFLCLIGGVVAAYVNFQTPIGHYVLLAVLLGLTVGTVLWLKIFPNTRLARVFISEQAVGDLGVEKPHLLGQTGTALSPLRPSGMALINGQRVDVVTEGSMIEPGTAIKVVALEGLRVVVRALPAAASSQSTQPPPSA